MADAPVDTSKPRIIAPPRLPELPDLSAAPQLLALRSDRPGDEVDRSDERGYMVTETTTPGTFAVAGNVNGVWEIARWLNLPQSLALWTAEEWDAIDSYPRSLWDTTRFYAPSSRYGQLWEQTRIKEDWERWEELDDES